jgi:RNA polymerase sigma factor (sigma-70 family)
MSNKLADNEIVAGILNGNEAAYRQLYTDHFNMVRYLVLKNSGSEDDANDVFQDALIVLFEKVKKGNFELTAALKTYVYSISRNVWFKRLRAAKGNDARIEDYENHISIEEEEESDLTEKQSVILKTCMEALGDPCKTLLTEFYFVKKSMKEIGEMLGYTSADHAKAQKYKCLKRLKKMALEAMQ